MRDRDKAIAAAAALFLLSRGGRRTLTPAQWGTGWAWPMPDLLLASLRFPAVVSQEFRLAGLDRAHYGVDVMYQRRSPLAMETIAWAPGTTSGATMYFCPPGTPVLAARAGVVFDVGETARGHHVVIDHGPPFATFYQHLERVDVAKGEQLAAAATLGVAGADLSGHDNSHLRHLHFAVWYDGAGDDRSVDPSDAMRSWARTTWRIGS